MVGPLFIGDVEDNTFANYNGSVENGHRIRRVQRVIWEEEP